MRVQDSLKPDDVLLIVLNGIEIDDGLCDYTGPSCF